MGEMAKQADNSLPLYPTPTHMAAVMIAAARNPRSVWLRAVMPRCRKAPAPIYDDPLSSTVRGPLIKE